VRVLIDCDPGHDDIIAIMTALANPDIVTVLGFTTVAGNQTVEKVTDNLLRVLDHLGISLPVAKGCDRPICRPPEPQPNAHGSSGMDGPILDAAMKKQVELGAVQFLYEKIMQEPEPVLLISLAPMTNLALLLSCYPQIRKKIAAIHLMGGSLYSGNILARAEFNMYHDPEAARIVFRSGVPLYMSGLEVCNRARTYFSEYAQLESGGKASKLMYDLMTFYSEYNRKLGKDYTMIFDAVPIVHLIAPSLFTAHSYNIDIETEGTLCRGMTVVDTRVDAPIQNHVTVLEDVDRVGYMRVLLDSIKRLDGMLP
jgi:pyrimidine-specific ribonucleoside hydrolase